MSKANDTNFNMKDRVQRAQSMIDLIWSPKSGLHNVNLYPVWISNTNVFWYVRETQLGKQVRLVNAEEWTNDRAFDHARLACDLSKAVGVEVDAENIPFSHMEIAFDAEHSGAKPLVNVAFTAFDKCWSFTNNSRECWALSLLSDNSPVNQKTSPNGELAVYKNGHNLWLRNLKSGEERALTHDGTSDFCYGASGSTWGEEMDLEPQVEWSPDGRRIFVVQRDTRNVLELPTMQHIPADGSVRPVVETIKMSYPGDEHVETLKLMSINCETLEIQVADYDQIPTTRNGFGFFSSHLGWWATDSRRAYFVDVSRDYKYARVVEFDTSTGKTRVLFEEVSDTQIDLMLNADERPTFMPLPDTDELLWFSERSGWAHLYLYDLNTGSVKKAVTQGDWVVRQILSVDQPRREVFIQTSGREPNRDPYYRDVCRVHMDTGELSVIIATDHDNISITQKDHNTALAQIFSGHDVSRSHGVAPTGDYVVVTQTRADQPPVSLLIDRNGTVVLALEEAGLSVLPENWQWPEPVKVKAADDITDLYGLVFRPSDFSENQSYPVISHVYNSPDLPWVSKGAFNSGMFYGYPYCDAAAIAELGFIVVQLDGRGTGFRSKQFHDKSYGWAESAGPFDDHVCGLRQLAERYTYMDLERVGIISPGGGPGGLQGLLKYPDFYKVGVANFLHDSRLMSASMWGDKYEGVDRMTTDNPYPEEYVEKLKGKLLLINGMLDTCTPPAGVFRVIDALQKAGKDFDMLLLPNLGHASPVGYVIRRSWSYLLKHLLSADLPEDCKVTTVFDRA